MTESAERRAHLAALLLARRAQSAPPAAGQPRRHPRAGARQGHHHRRRHPGEPARHRAAHHQDPAADRLGRQGPGDGHRLVAQRPDAQRRREQTWPRRTAELRERIEELEGRRTAGRGLRRRPLPRTRSPAWPRRRDVARPTSRALADGRLEAVDRAPRTSQAGGQHGRPRRVRRGGAAPQPRGPGLAGGGRPRPRRRGAGGRGAQAPTAPMRLATICLDDDGVRRAARRWHDALTDVLDRVEGRVEWSVKVLRRPERRAGAEPTAQPHGRRCGVPAAQEGRGPGPRGRREQRDCQLVAEVSTSSSLRGRRGRPPAGAPGPAAHRRPERMILNGAYLVRATEADAFAAAGRRARADPPRGGRRAPRPVAAVLLRDAGAVSEPSASTSRSVRHDRRAAPGTAGRSRWSTCSTGCSAPASCSPATS